MKVRWWLKPCKCKVTLPDEPPYTTEALRKGWKPIDPPARVQPKEVQRSN